MKNTADFIIIAGIIIIVIGLAIKFNPGGGIPRLPGDIYIKKENFTFYFPITSLIILSLILSLVFKLFK